MCSAAVRVAAEDAEVAVREVQAGKRQRQACGHRPSVFLPALFSHAARQ